MSMFRNIFLVFLLKWAEISAQNATCGTPEFPPHGHTRLSARVVGGQESIPHSWPWMVLIRYNEHPITCGGVLVRGSSGDLVVLTAAHCVDGYSAASIGDWKLSVGVHSRSAQEQNQMEYGVKQILIHPNFNFQYLEDDIAVMIPSLKIAENNYVRPLCMTTQDSNVHMVGKECVVAGWGSDYQGGPPVDRLHEVYKPILSDAQCSNALQQFGYNGTVMLCAGNLAQGGVDACSYDSGVPFACKNANGIWELVGISSWGYGCAQAGYPGVYTEVYNFLQWIQANSHTDYTSGGIVG